jgi:hypothetical protein
MVEPFPSFIEDQQLGATGSVHVLRVEEPPLDLVPRPISPAKVYGSGTKDPESFPLPACWGRRPSGCGQPPQERVTCPSACASTPAPSLTRIRRRVRIRSVRRIDVLRRFRWYMTDGAQPFGWTPSVHIEGSRQLMRVILSCGPGATGEFAPKYVTSASRSTSPPRRSVPSGRTEKLSPPSERKLLTVIR